MRQELSDLRIVFFGTPSFAATILDFLISKNANIVAVVTKPDKPYKRSSALKAPPVKELILQKAPEIPLFQPLKAGSEDFATTLKSFDADFFCVAAYSEIFKDNLLQMPRIACLNVHASILPKYRGAAPIARAIMAGEKESGVTIISMARQLDAGGMLKISKTPISDEMTAGELMEKLAELGSLALWEVICAYARGEVQLLEQNSLEANYASKLTDEDGLIHWENEALSLHNQIRGVTPNPGAWVYLLHKGVKKRVRIGRAKIEKGVQGDPGSILSSSGDSLIIACGKEGLSLLEVQLEGKKMMPIADFLRGISKKDLTFSDI